MPSNSARLRRRERQIPPERSTLKRQKAFSSQNNGLGKVSSGRSPTRNKVSSPSSRFPRSPSLVRPTSSATHISPVRSRRILPKTKPQPKVQQRRAPRPRPLSQLAQSPSLVRRRARSPIPESQKSPTRGGDSVRPLPALSRNRSKQLSDRFDDVFGFPSESSNSSQSSDSELGESSESDPPSRASKRRRIAPRGVSEFSLVRRPGEALEMPTNQPRTPRLKSWRQSLRDLAKRDSLEPLSSPGSTAGEEEPMDLEGDGTDDICRVCGDPGMLISCSKCPSSFHMECLSGYTWGAKNIDDIPDDWVCGPESIRRCTTRKSAYVWSSDGRKLLGVNQRMPTFAWTDSKPLLSKDGELCYESFVLDGEVFRVGDAILVDNTTGSSDRSSSTAKRDEETSSSESLETEYVGKIGRIWEDHTVAWVDVQWYFQPHELPKRFRSRAEHPRELFLSSQRSSLQLTILTGRAHVLTRSGFFQHSRIGADFRKRMTAQPSGSSDSTSNISDRSDGIITEGVPKFSPSLLFFCERTFDPTTKKFGDFPVEPFRGSREAGVKESGFLDPVNQDGAEMDGEDSDTNFSMSEEDEFSSASSSGEEIPEFADLEDLENQGSGTKSRRTQSRGRSRKSVRKLRLVRATKNFHEFNQQKLQAADSEVGEDGLDSEDFSHIINRLLAPQKLVASRIETQGPLHESTETLLLSREALQEQLRTFQRAAHRLQLSWNPEELPCREKEFSSIYQFLCGALRGGGAGGTSLYVSGMPGTGKTATVYRAVKQLYMDLGESDTEDPTGVANDSRSSSSEGESPTKLQQRHPRSKKFTSAGARSSKRSSRPGRATIPSETKSESGSAKLEPEGEIERRENKTPFVFAEVNGMHISSIDAAYVSILYALTGKRLPSNKACRALNQYFRRGDADKPVCILLVDELDSLLDRKQGFFYNLFDWPTIPESKLIVVGIANAMNLPEQLQPKIQSRLGLQRVIFPAYTPEQIQTILQSRLTRISAIPGLPSPSFGPRPKPTRGKTLRSATPNSPAFDPDAVELCARKVAATSGDLRRALQICRQAIQICRRDLLNSLRPVSGKSSRSAGKKGPGKTTVGDEVFFEATSSTTQVLIGHVDRAIQALYDNGYVEWIAGATPHEMLLFACSLNLMSTTGAELLDFGEVSQRVQNGCHLKGLRTPTAREILRLCERLEQLGVLDLEYNDGSRLWPELCLAVQRDDIRFALRRSEFWGDLRVSDDHW